MNRDLGPTYHQAPRESKILNAQPVPPSKEQKNLHETAVLARIEWETGTEKIETVAYAYTKDLVLVEILDPRARLVGYWIPAKDVTRI